MTSEIDKKGYRFGRGEQKTFMSHEGFHGGVGIAQSTERLATGWTVRGSDPGGGEIFRTRPDQPWGATSILYNVYRVSPGVKWPGRGVDHPSHLAPRLKKE